MHAIIPPLISVVVPVYNAGALLLEAIDSIARQAIGPVELIVVDDGSTDDPAARLAAAALPATLLHQANRGPAAARNRGLEAARGRYVAFLDADDIWPRHALAALADRLVRDSSIELAQGHIRRFRAAAADELDGPATVIGPAVVSFNLGSALFRRDLLVRLGGFDETRRTSEDVEFWVRARQAGVAQVVIPEVTLLYRRGHGSLMEGFTPAARTAEHLKHWTSILARTIQVRRAQQQQQQ